LSTPKGFRKNYFSLAAIQAHASMKKIASLSISTLSLDAKPLKIKINSPPSA
jgi:hypothetical protein